MDYKKKTLPELLAPAGSFEHFVAAIKAGADAIYVGGMQFGARAYAANFDEESLVKAISYAHFYDRKVYLTVNTLIKDQELYERLFSFLKPYYEAGLDGVIVQDIGAASFIREHFPGMEIHGSTQMSIMSVQGAQVAAQLGMNRIVPARELSLSEIQTIKRETGLDIEVFVHGALCYCYSGQCLLSSMYGGRSGNRGRCAQPCRLPYRVENAQQHPLTKLAKHILSPKDLCSLEQLPALIEAGVDSLKIEGRMKNVEYVAGVTHIYRKYLDLYKQSPSYSVQKEDLNFLEELYSRSGFTKGYWNMHNGKQMMSIDTPRHMGRPIGKIISIQKNRITLSLNSDLHPKDILVIPEGKEEEIILTVPNAIDELYSTKKGKKTITLNAPHTNKLSNGDIVYRRKNEQISSFIKTNILDKTICYDTEAIVKFNEGKEAVLTLKSRNDSVTVFGPCVTHAQKHPVTEPDILRQLEKTGNVPFTLKKCELQLDEEVFLPSSAIKQLRQKGYETLEKAHSTFSQRTTPSMPDSTFTKSIVPATMPQQEKEKIATVYDQTMLNLCINEPFFQGICLSSDFLTLTSLMEWKTNVHKSQKNVYLSLPKIIRNCSKNALKDFLDDTICDNIKWNGIYVNNINEYCPDIDYSKYCEKVIFGASYYEWNLETQTVIQRLFHSDISLINELPTELSVKEWTPHPDSAGCEAQIFGRIPVMVSAQCIKKTTGFCNQTPEKLWITDTQKRRLPVTTHCRPFWAKGSMDCYNIIWLDQPLNRMKNSSEKEYPSFSRFRFDLFGMNTKECLVMIEEYSKWK